MTREELEKAMGNEPKIQASFEVIGDDVKFIKLIVNGKENIVSVEELENTPSETYRETDDYENEIADLHNRLDIAEYDKERLREEVTILEEKLKALYTEPCDCISRAELLKAVDTWDRFGCDAGSSKLVPIKDCYVSYIHYDDVVKAIKGMPSIQPKTGHWIVYEDCEGKTRRCVCDRCRHETGDYTWKNPNFCENCGAKMVEPHESEVKE